ncbi:MULTISPECIES: hypothetical protein [unclassified Novosphingobium]|uniref:hypothetical protein n=1 Tax=unclassified Novosphingobium TaxID=2644732 RepID=UPI00135B40DD|nr:MULTISPECIES: hypothetical protein [unclassified Novosphingobium]
MQVTSSPVAAHTVTTALERAARALCYVHGVHPNERMGSNPSWMHYLPEAQAVLEAVRDPSTKMSVAGNHELNLRCGRQIDEQDVETTWRAMIDAALAER